MLVSHKRDLGGDPLRDALLILQAKTPLRGRHPTHTPTASRRGARACWMTPGARLRKRVPGATAESRRRSGDVRDRLALILRLGFALRRPSFSPPPVPAGGGVNRARVGPPDRRSRTVC